MKKITVDRATPRAAGVPHARSIERLSELLSEHDAWSKRVARWCRTTPAWRWLQQHWASQRPVPFLINQRDYRPDCSRRLRVVSATVTERSVECSLRVPVVLRFASTVPGCYIDARYNLPLNCVYDRELFMQDLSLSISVVND